MTTDDVTHLRALLADATARAEKAETERDAALAACAEMRAALESIRYDVTENVVIPGAHKALLAGVDEKCRALLSRPDLGAGKVLVERERLTAWRDVLQRLPRAGWGYTDAERAAVADLDALLKKGGG